MSSIPNLKKNTVMIAVRNVNLVIVARIKSKMSLIKYYHSVLSTVLRDPSLKDDSIIK